MPTANKLVDLTELRLAALDPSLLQGLVASAIGRIDLHIDSWRFIRLSGGLGGGVGGTAVYRLMGECSGQSVFCAWSLILKVLCAREGEQPSSRHYWRREVEAYRSGLLSELPGELRAPRYFGVTEQPDSCWLWLEDIQDDVSGRWSIEQHALVARHLGQFNAGYLAGIPDWSWLSRDWIRQDVTRFGQLVMQLEPYRQYPLIRRWLSYKTVEAMQRLWLERELFLTALNHLPQTLCHLDAFRRNLFIRQGNLIAIDWSFVGVGPIGADLVAPFLVNSVFEEIDPARMQELDSALFENYCDGLHDRGWKGDPRQARLGYIAAMGLRWLASIGINVPQVAQRLRDGEAVSDSFIENVSASGAYISDLADEARQLISRGN